MSDQQQPYDHQKWTHELKRQDAQRAHDKIDESFHIVNADATKAAELTLRVMMLINGGAAIAVLTFIGGLVAQGRIKVEQLNDMATSLTLIAIGVACAVAGIAFSYFTHYCMAGMERSYTKKWEHPFVEPGPHTTLWWRLNIVFHVCAVVTAIASLVIFVCGMLDVRSAISHLAALH